MRGAGGDLGAAGRALAAGAGSLVSALTTLGAAETRGRNRELERLQKLADANALTAATSAVTRGSAEIEDGGDPLSPDFVDDQDERIGKLIDDTITKMPTRSDGRPMISPEALAVLGERTTKLRDAAFKRNLKSARDATEKQAVDNLAGSANDISAKVRRNPARLLVGLNALDGLYEDFGGTLDADALRDNKAADRADAVEASVRGFLDGGNFPAARSLLADERFDRDLSEDKRNALSGEVDTEEKAARSGARKLVDTVAGVLKAGETPPADDLAAARDAAAPFDELRADLMQAARLGKFAGELRRQPPVVMQNAINALRGEKTKTAEDLERLGVAERILGEAKTALDKDPLSYAARSGVVELAPLDPQDPASVRQRIAAAAKVESVYGVDAVPFTDEEIADTVNAYKNADATGRLTIVRGLVDMRMPEPMLNDALNALNAKAPEMGLVADLVTRDLVTARQVLLGQEFLKNNPGSAPAKIDVDEVLDDVLGDALRADEPGKARAAVIAAANGFYVQSRIGEPPGFDTDAYADAIEAVVGTIVERNGQRTILPPGISEDQFNAVIDGLTDETLHPVSGLGPGEVVSDVPLGPHRMMFDGTLVEASAEKVRRDGRLITVGPGRYFVAFLAPFGVTGEVFTDQVEFALDGAGDPYVFDFNELAQRAVGTEAAPGSAVKPENTLLPGP